MAGRRIRCSTRRSPKSTRNNVKQLERAWFYPVPGESDRLVFNPLIVDNVMYVSGVRRRACGPRCLDRQRVVGVDAARDRARPGVLGESRPIGSPSHPDRQQRHPPGRRAHRPADYDVRHQRVRRHAHRISPAQWRTQQQPRPGLRKPHHRRIERRRRLRIAARRYSRVRRHHRQAGLDVSHHSPSGRLRIRDVAGRCVQIRGRRQHVGRPDARREERYRLSADRIADARPVRRRSPRQTISSAIA